MTVQDADIAETVVKISDYFNKNISTRFIRPLLVGILADHELSRRISEITEYPDEYAAQGIHLDELYAQIHALARFIYLVRTDILPNIRGLTSGSGLRDANRIYRDMAINNFGANIQVFSDFVNELYIKTVSYDRAHSPKGKPMFHDIPGLSEIGRYLVGN